MRGYDSRKRKSAETDVMSQKAKPKFKTFQKQLKHQYYLGRKCSDAIEMSYLSGKSFKSKSVYRGTDAVVKLFSR